MVYEDLEKLALTNSVVVFEKEMSSAIKGLYSNGTVWINKGLPTRIEKVCVLAEELGHYHTTIGDILDQSKLENRKHEGRARYWAYEKLVPLNSIIVAHKSGIRNRHELAKMLSVTEEFLDAALKRYQEKHGLYIIVGCHTIVFEPLGVLELFE